MKRTTTIILLFCIVLLLAPTTAIFAERTRGKNENSKELDYYEKHVPIGMYPV